MTTLGITVFIISITIGFFIKLKFDNDYWSVEKITWGEFIVGAIIIALFFSWAAVKTEWWLAWNHRTTFHEYWNGWEISAGEDIIKCTINGPCKYEYDCNCRQVCNSRDEDGDCTSYRTECDDCPYFEFERKLYVDTTLGRFDIAWLAPEDYQQHKKTWSLPWGFGPKDYKTPQFWLDAKARCESGNPGPVTKRMSYKNYILASEGTILKEYSDIIDALEQQQLLPPLERGIHDFYMANKAYFVGINVTNPQTWQEAAARFNAALGNELHGDLHLVIIKHNLVNPDQYIIALKAYWQDVDRWGKDALSKNAVVVVLGTDGQQIVWARATTGMPIGNEGMIAAVRAKIPDTPLAPQTILGNIQGQFTQDGDKIDVVSKGDNGILRRIMWGLDNPNDKFVRVSMSADDPDDVGTGFNYLKREIQPTTGQKVAIVLVTTLLSLIVWFVLLAVDF